jgi:putative membrane protein
MLSLVLLPLSFLRIRRCKVKFERSWQWIAASLALLVLGILAAVTHRYAEAPGWISMLAPFVLASPSCWFLWKRSGSKGLLLLIELGVFAFLVESAAVLTGYPYGVFAYTAAAGPLLGVVPPSVLIAWSTLVLASVALASRVTRSPAARFVLALVVLVSCDVVLDPAAVRFGLWQYARGEWLSVPWSNYAGWLLTGAVGISLTMRTALGSDVAVSALLTLSFWTGFAAGSALSIPVLFGGVLLSCFSWLILDQGVSRKRARYSDGLVV